MPGDARLCQVMPGDARRFQAMSGNVSAMPRDVRRCQAMSGGVRRCKVSPKKLTDGEVPVSGGVRRCQAVSGGVRRCQAVSGGVGVREGIPSKIFYVVAKYFENFKRFEKLACRLPKCSTLLAGYKNTLFVSN